MNSLNEEKEKNNMNYLIRINEERKIKTMVEYE
jgi:hypothetical protein